MTLSDDENAHWIGYDRCKAKDDRPTGAGKPMVDDKINTAFQPYPFPKLERRWLDEIV